MKTKKNILIILFLVSCCLQNIVLINLGTFGLKFFHLFSLIFLIPIIKNKRIKLPPKMITIIFIYIFGISIISSVVYGFNSLLFNYIFCYYILIVILNVCKEFDKEEWKEIFSKSAWIILMLVYINLFLNIDIILEFIKKPNGHPVYMFVFGGGANLEATWTGMFGFFLKNNKKGFIYSGLALIISALLASRVGIICNVICFFYLFFFNKKGEKISIKNKVIIVVGALTLLTIVMLKYNLFDYIIKRFLTIGTDPGSQGRLKMWKYVWDASLNNPIGYGLGNSIKALSIVAGYTIKEGNVHNLLFQMLLDTGFVGAMIYLMILIYFFNLAVKYFLKNPYIAFLSTYFLLGFLQFRGGEPLMFFVLAVFLQQKLYIKEDLTDE